MVAAKARLVRLDQTEPVDIETPFEPPPALSDAYIKSLHGPSPATIAAARRARAKRREQVDWTVPPEDRLAAFLKQEGVILNRVRALSRSTVHNGPSHPRSASRVPF